MLRLLSALVGAALFFAPGTNLYADLVVQYDFANATTTPSVTTSGSSPLVTAGNLATGGGLVAVNDSEWRWKDWHEGTTFETAVEAGNAWTWGFTLDASSEMELDLTTLDLGLYRSTAGPDRMEVRAEINSSDYSVLEVNSLDATSGFFTGVDLAALPAVQPGDSVVFTLAAWAPINSFGSLEMKGLTGLGSTAVRVNGDFAVASVPEASPVWLGGLVAALLGLGHLSRSIKGWLKSL